MESRRSFFQKTVATLHARTAPLLHPPHRLLLLFLAVYSLTALAFWDGIGPRDAERYIAAALQWSESGPFLGENHWALRHLLVLPMAGLFAVFGPSEFLACVPNFIYGALLVAITFHFGRRRLGAVEGNILTLLIATSAFLAIQSGELRIYGVEVFFVALSLWLFVSGADEGRTKTGVLFAAGFSAGCAWLCREATGFLPLALGAAALLSKAPFFRVVAPLAGGFLVVLVSELAFYQIFASDAFYRYRIDLGHGGGSPRSQVGGPAEGESLLLYIGRPVKELLSYPTVTPFIVIALALGFWLARANRLQKNVRPTLTTFGLGAALSFLIAGYPLRLEEVEYYPITSYFAAIVTAVALVAVLNRRGAFVMGAAAAGLVGLNLAAADFRDYDEYSEARLLVDLVEERDETIFADPITIGRARHLLRLRGYSTEAAADRLRLREHLAPGGLVMQATPAGVSYFFPSEADWTEIARYAPRRLSWTRALLRAFVPRGLQPPRLREILAPSNPVILFRASDEGADQVSLTDSR